MAETLDTNVMAVDTLSPVEQATRIIDTTLAGFIGRELLSASEVSDALLDARNALAEL